jgi:hypothetical protein
LEPPGGLQSEDRPRQPVEEPVAELACHPDFRPECSTAEPEQEVELQAAPQPVRRQADSLLAHPEATPGQQAEDARDGLGHSLTLGYDVGFWHADIRWCVMDSG